MLYDLGEVSCLDTVPEIPLGNHTLSPSLSGLRLLAL